MELHLVTYSIDASALLRCWDTATLYGRGARSPIQRFPSKNSNCEMKASKSCVAIIRQHRMQNPGKAKAHLHQLLANSSECVCMTESDTKCRRHFFIVRNNRTIVRNLSHWLFPNEHAAVALNSALNRSRKARKNQTSYNSWRALATLRFDPHFQGKIPPWHLCVGLQAQLVSSAGKVDSPAPTRGA